jgi:chemotaxis protein CheD
MHPESRRGIQQRPTKSRQPGTPTKKVRQYRKEARQRRRDLVGRAKSTCCIHATKAALIVPRYKIQAGLHKLQWQVTQQHYSTQKHAAQQNSIYAGGIMNQEVELQHIFLHPGEYVVGTSACRISTLLGSCVSIVLWHAASKIGAMSHFLLPSRGERELSAFEGRYGDEVLDLMLRELARAGIAPHQCQGSIYGGGNMFAAPAGNEQIGIGKKNGDIARRQLLSRSIPIVAESLFGNTYRKIEFNVESGEVKVQKMAVAPEIMQCKSKEKSVKKQDLFQCGDDWILASAR